MIFETDPNLSGLLDFRPGKRYKAERGGDGQAKNMYGKDGADLVLHVPPGTQIVDTTTGALLADMNRHPQREVIVPGGRGGRGNAHFATSVQQAPKFSEKGEPADERTVHLELKLLADVGLLGFPNVGKSTFLARVSAARPKIADYPFTTLVPNLGVVRVDDHHHFVLADIPGLIEGAHEGAGLGTQFLKHLERTRLLVHLIDVSGLSGRDPLTDFDIIQQELAAFSADLATLPQIVALSRIDTVADRTSLASLEERLHAHGLPVFPLSSVSGEGVDALVFEIHRRLQALPRPDTVANGPIRITLDSAPDDDPRRFTIQRNPEGVLVVSGKGIERAVAMTDMHNEDAVRRLQRRLERWGVFRKLRAAGAVEGDSVQIRDVEFDYTEDDAVEEVVHESI